MRWASPYWLFALALVPLVVWCQLRPRGRATVRFSSLELLERLGNPWTRRLSFVPPLLRAAAIGLIVLAMARPQKGDQQTRIFTEGIAIQMAVDISSSMLTPDFVLDGQRATRVDAVKRVFKEFVVGAGGLEGRENDLIGMVTFARYAESVCPLTLDHDNLIRILDRTQGVRPRSPDDGTSLGDGIALAVERLRSLAQRKVGDVGQEIKSKVIILLTDGAQTVPESMDPVEAARLAGAFDIKVYTIGAGRPESRFFAMPLDEATLKEVARISGGKYFRATDTEALRRIYAEIDQLEKTKTDVVRYMQYTELAAPFLLTAFGLIGLELLLVNTRFRRIP